HETSANALTWTLFLLSQHPQIAQDVLDELQSVLNGVAPTVEQLQKLAAMGVPLAVDYIYQKPDQEPFS
ncbi:MAG: cytochrome P450, partial [Bacteroidota bacterium]